MGTFVPARPVCLRISEVNGDTVIDLGADGTVTLMDFALTDFGDSDMFQGSVT